MQCMKRKLQIFVSSTYKDLIPERQAAVQAVLKAGHIPAGMELFTAGDESQWQTIKRWIEDSDAFMLILGSRYGSIEPTSGLSYVECEYEYAISKEKPFFAVVIEQAEIERRIKPGGQEIVEEFNPQLMKAFRDRVLTRTSSFFSDCKDIKLAVHEAIGNIATRKDVRGWVAFADIPDVAGLGLEIDRLRKENESLRKEASLLRKQALKATSGDSAAEAELVQLLSEMPVEIPKKFSNDGATNTSVLAMFYGYRDAFTHGLANTVGAGELSNWLFSEIGSKLEAHELVDNVKINNGKARELVLSKKGRELLAYLDKVFHRADKDTQSRAG